MTAERREMPRRVLRVHAALSVAGKPPIDVRTIDIGLGGMCLAIPVNVPVGTRCVVGVDLPLKDNRKRSFQA